MRPEMRHPEPGEVLFLAGMGGEEAYLVRRGEIAIYVARDGRPRNAAARAIGATDVMVLPRRLVESKPTRASPIIRAIIEGYLDSIRQGSRDQGQ